MVYSEFFLTWDFIILLCSIDISQIPAGFTIGCMFFSLFNSAQRSQKSPCFTKIYSVDPDRSIKAIGKQDSKNASPKYAAILPRHGMPSPVPS